MTTYAFLIILAGEVFIADHNLTLNDCLARIATYAAPADGFVCEKE